MNDIKCNKKCGKCCMKLHNFTKWKSKLVYSEIQYLLKERQKYLPKYKNNGCIMLIFENNEKLCLIEKLLNRNKKPTCCLEYICKE